MGSAHIGAHYSCLPTVIVGIGVYGYSFAIASSPDTVARFYPCLGSTPLFMSPLSLLRITTLLLMFTL